METLEMRNKIREFLLKHIRVEGFAGSDNIFESGYVNSLFAMQLVLFVEKTFEVKVENEDLDIRNFSSLDAVYAFVSKKKGSSA